MHPVRFAVFAAALALAACAHARKPDVALPAAYEAPQQGGASAAVLDRWWTTFDDPQLTSLVEHSLAANPDARTASARLREARASAAASLTQFLPQGDATASARRTHTTQLSGTIVNFPGFSTSGTNEQDAANLNVSWEVDLFGRIFAAGRAARGDVAAVRFDYEATRASLAAQTADAYFQARGFAIQLADAREEVRIQQELYDVAAKRAAVGIGTSADADRVAGELAQAKSQAETLDGELRAELRTLLILAGRPADSITTVDASPSVGRVPPVPATLPSELLRRRPDVREAQARIESAAGRLRLANLAFFPTLMLTPGVGWSRVVQPGFRSTSQSWTIGGSATQPVFSLPTLLEDLKAQDARTEEAVIAYEKAVQTAFGEAESALVRLDVDERRVGILTDGEVRARRAYEASRKGYQRGLNDLQTVLSAEESWRSTRIQLTSARVQGLRDAVAAFKAIGGGWDTATQGMTGAAR
ncbi:TolC family protein [Phenylobacterium sp.]|uniref:efflux transporter outer membrane subunit n=1 Tax=Phenylobacterium sp. TaxID=1871053 RepID=UPI0026099733|nr:TolC family protein [Phenylobacterium sp.]